MARERSTNRTQALKLWLKSGRQMLLKDIGVELGVSDAMIRKWKFLDKWDEIPEKRPRGGQKGNTNSVGNKGGPGGPEGNDHAIKHGYYAKYLPEAVLQIVQEIQDSDPVEMVWNNIILLQAKLLHGQQITHVKDSTDMTKELKKKKPGMFGMEKEWELQFAHDKFANASKTDVLIMRELRSAIKQFLSMAPENDERRKKLEHMQLQIDKTKQQIEQIDKIINPKKEVKDELKGMKDSELLSSIEKATKSIASLRAGIEAPTK